MSSTAEAIVPTQSPLLHPIQNCLDEILCEIFLSIIIDNYGRLTYGDGSSEGRCPSPVFTLSAVCSKWRLVCLNNAKLWAYIVIGWHSCGEADDGASFQRMCLQIERSKAAPLHVNAEFRCCPWTCGIVTPIFRVVANECHRWKSFSSDNSLKHNELLTLFPSSATVPLLHTLRYMECTQRLDEGHRAFPFTGFTNLRSLQTKMRSTSCMDPTIPWNRLTSLRIYYEFDHSLDDLLQYLSMCPNLEDFRLMSNSDWVVLLNTSRKHVPDSIVLYNLRKLDLALADDGRGDIIMPYIRTPNLRNLIYHNLDTSSIKIIVNLIKRSSCTLTSFTAALPMEQDLEALQSLLRSLPGITSLRIDNTADAHWTPQDVVSCDSVLRLLCGNEPELCPRLRRLKLDCAGFEPALLVQFMESREGRDSVTPICDLSLFISTQQQPLYEWCNSVLKERLQKQKARGLSLHVW